MEFKLTHEESIVFFDFLSRFEYDEKLQIHHPSEEFVLSKIHGQLETSLVEPFEDKWANILSKARQNIESKHGLSK